MITEQYKNVGAPKKKKQEPGAIVLSGNDDITIEHGKEKVKVASTRRVDELERELLKASSKIKRMEAKISTLETNLNSLSKILHTPRSRR